MHTDYLSLGVGHMVFYVAKGMGRGHAPANSVLLIMWRAMWLQVRATRHPSSATLAYDLMPFEWDLGPGLTTSPLLS